MAGAGKNNYPKPLTRFLFGQTAADYKQKAGFGPWSAMSKALPLDGTLSRLVTRASGVFGLVQLASVCDKGVLALCTNVKNVVANDANKAHAAFVEQIKKPDQIGYITESGTKYCGTNVDKNGNIYHVYTTPYDLTTDGTNHSDSKALVKNANKEKLYGHDDWDLPTGFASETNELKNNLYANKEDIGGFKVASSYDRYMSYWSSTEDNLDYVCVKCFLNGLEAWDNRLSSGGYTRPVRRVYGELVT